MVRVVRRDERGVSNWVILVLLVIVVGAILGVYFTYLVPGPLAPPVRALPGDFLQVDYIGSFPESGLVFDTSNQTVAVNNASYPKAFSFGWRSTWTTLSVTIGQHAVVKGFEDGLVGLQRGQTSTIIVPPELGYGAADPTKIHVHDLLESVPVRTVWNLSAFTLYFKTAPVSGGVVTDPIWGWPVSVSMVNTIVTAVASPTPGQDIRPYGAWDAQVVSIDDLADNGTGVILAQHLLDASAVDRIGGSDPSGSPFYVSAVDLSGGTYTLNFNRHVVGRTLVFQVTVVDLSRLS